MRDDIPINPPCGGAGRRMHGTGSLLWRLARPLAVVYAAAAAAVGIWGLTSERGWTWIIVLRTALTELSLLALVVYTAHRLVLTQLIGPLRRVAELDELTGLARAGAFWARAEAMLDGGYRRRQSVVFVFLDLDDFKQINDRLGHLTGDSVLRTLGRLLREEVRADDVVGRIGGEEFGWLMPATTKERALQAVQRLLDVCRAIEVEGVHGFTFSAGIATIRGDEPDRLSAWDLAREADGAQYQAKAMGKGRVICC